MRGVMVTPMSPFSSTYDEAHDPATRRGDDRAHAESKKPTRPVTGPVLLGDIHPAPGGRPLLLSLWAQWEDAARKG